MIQNVVQLFQIFQWSCPRYISVVVVKYPCRRQFRGERLYLWAQVTAHPWKEGEVKAGMWSSSRCIHSQKQGRMQHACPFSPSHTNPGDGVIHSGLDLPRSVEDNPCKHALRPDWEKQALTGTRFPRRLFLDSVQMTIKFHILVVSYISCHWNISLAFPQLLGSCDLCQKNSYRAQRTECKDE